MQTTFVSGVKNAVIAWIFARAVVKPATNVQPFAITADFAEPVRPSAWAAAAIAQVVR